MLAELRKTLRALEQPAEPQSAPLSLGIEPIDAALGGGLARGALHEIAAVGEAHVGAAIGFTLGVASLFSSGPRQNLVWIPEDMALAESGAPYGPGLDAFGLAPERLLTVTAAHTRDLFWAMEEALRCRAVGAVIGELRHGEIDGVAVRRLSLAAGENGALAILLRASPPHDASTAATRWIVSAALSSPSPGWGESPSSEVARRGGVTCERNSPPPGALTRADLPPPGGGETDACFAVRLTRNRRGSLGQWILQWSESNERFVLAAHAQPVAAPPADRPRRQVA